MTLCLDILHRPKAEPEFAEHKKLVTQAIAFLGRYDDSTLAVRGVRLLSSLLEGATKHQPSGPHARHDKDNNAYTHHSGSWAWPLEDRQNIDARNDDGSFNAINHDSVISDTSWWTGFFSDYFPAQSIFENRSFIEDLIPQAT